MKNTNEDIIAHFFDAYSKHDFDAIKNVMSEDIIWVFLGQHPLAGVKNGIEEVVAFFDNMSALMGASNIKVEKLVAGSNDNFLIECQHISTHR